MKNTQLKKAQFNPSLPLDNTEVNPKGKVKETPEVFTSQEGYRKVRHSAAMIGLALSVGTTGIMISSHDQVVLANEPNTDELYLTVSSEPEEQTKEITKNTVKENPPAPVNPVVEVAPLVPEYSSETEVKTQNVPQAKVAPEEKLEIAPPRLQHQVKEGETLWQLSQEYQVSPEQIAQTNQIGDNGLIIAGQTIDIPVEIANQEVAVNPSFSQGQSDAVLKQQQDLALIKLQQEKQELQKQLNVPVSNNQVTPPEVAILPPEAIEIPVVLEQNNSVEIAQNQNSGGNSVVAPIISAQNLPAPVETALNPMPTTPEKTGVKENTTTIIPETAFLPGGEGRKPVDFHHFTEPITIPVPLPGIAEQDLASTQNQANLSELSQIPIPVQETIAFAPVPASPQIYTVRQGDTLDSIAQNHGISVSELMTENNLTNPHLIRINQELRVPEGQAKTNPVPASPEVAVIIPETSVNSNSSLPTISQNPPIQTGSRLNAEDNAVAKMTEDLNRLRESAPVAPSGDNNTVAFNPSRNFNQPIEIPVEPYRVINPEWQNTDGGRTINPTVAPTVAPVQMGTVPTRRREPEQLIAAAPISSGSYNPMFQLPIGETVSPELPGLNSPEQYLPNVPNSRFEGYMWPARGVLTSGYGRRWGRMHRGIDIAAPIGTPILAAAPGEVIFSGWNSGGYGNLVKIRHDNGSVTLYAHNNRLLVRSGQYVEQGQQIAEMGSTGFSTGPHLHFEIHPSGSGAVNPIAHLPRR